MATPGERRIPTRAEVEAYLRERSNWGRWGDDDQQGAVNLITPEKKARAAALVRSGRSVSLSRVWPRVPGVNNPSPAQQFMLSGQRGTGGFAVDFYGITYHGHAATHLDALCHVWDGNGMWNGRDPAKEITMRGARFGDVDQWREGIITRGVLLDVPRYRGTPFASREEPVHGWELEAIAASQGVALEPGDAVIVHSGRERFQEAYPERRITDEAVIHASCLPFLREHDVAVLGWDFMDGEVNEYGLPWTVHAAIFAFGVALLDNCLLEPLSQACAEESRYEFMLTVAPLRVPGGTGSPVNPLALF
jgi:kynurenine formamidase